MKRQKVEDGELTRAWNDVRGCLHVKSRTGTSCTGMRFFHRYHVNKYRAISKNRDELEPVRVVLVCVFPPVSCKQIQSDK